MGSFIFPPSHPPLWGDETRRSLHFFSIGRQTMPLPLIRAMAEIKRAAALVNGELELISPPVAQAVAEAAAEVAAGQHDDQFPLSVWQTGSGTQSHMNVNEVIAALVHARHPELHVDAHDDVNRGQSTNDVFPSAIHIAATLALRDDLLPALHQLRAALADKAVAWAQIIKLGRTHMQDATPIALGQEFGAYDAQLAHCETDLRAGQSALHRLALGGTAVGTGINSPRRFAPAVIARLAKKLHLPLSQAPNLFAAIAGREAIVSLHAALRGLAIALIKIGNDVRLMGSGPHAGLGELRLPENEPGSSIMPGKVNPTQVEALTMVCAQVIGHDVAMGFAASQGQFQLNAYMPLMALNLLESLALLAGAMNGFCMHCVKGLQVQSEKLNEQLSHGLMLATGLVPHIGHARAAQVVSLARQTGGSLRDAALTLAIAPAEDIDRWLNPQHLLTPTPEA
jgi:fumarate hydratase class II